MPSTIVLTSGDVATGLKAIKESMGVAKGRAFLEAISKGALDASLAGKATAWVRRNPEVTLAAAQAVGTFFATLMASPKKQTKHTVAKVKLVEFKDALPALPATSSGKT